MTRAREIGGTALLGVVVSVAFLVLLAPIAYIAIFSFNDGGRQNLVWAGATLDTWRQPCANTQLCEAVGTSLVLGVLAAVLATMLGIGIALALDRHRFRGDGAVGLLIILAMTSPEIVLGASALSLFLNLGVPLGFPTVLMMHVMFCISFVVVAIRARLVNFDRSLEWAAADSYATPAVVFLRITLPLLAPAILAALLLSFSLSFDDLIITRFTSGPLDTYPTFVYASARRGVSPDIYVIATALFVVALTFVLVGRLITVARRRRD